MMNGAPENARSDPDGPLVQAALEEAMQDAASSVTRLEETQTEDSLKAGHAFLNAIKGEVKRARKGRMRTIEYYLCDSCDKPILNPQDGLVVHGNIYTADPSCNGGLIGNNIPDSKELVSVENIKKTVLCRSCFMEAIKVMQHTEAVKHFSSNRQPVEEKQYDDDGVPF